MSEWISVKTRLPSRAFDVLVFADHNIYIGYWEHGEWILRGADLDDECITHWRDLPSHPQD